MVGGLVGGEGTGKIHTIWRDGRAGVPGLPPYDDEGATTGRQPHYMMMGHMSDSEVHVSTIAHIRRVGRGGHNTGCLFYQDTEGLLG